MLTSARLYFQPFNNAEPVSSAGFVRVMRTWKVMEFRFVSWKVMENEKYFIKTWVSLLLEREQNTNSADLEANTGS